MIAIDGGIISPMEPQQAHSAPENGFSYFLFVISGTIIAPMAAASATPEPDIPPIIIPVIATTMASPPRIGPTKQRQKSMIRFVIPPWLIKAPASINNGIAISGKESTAVNILWARTVIG